MRIDLIDATAGEGFEALPPTTLSFVTGQVTLAAVETAQRPTLLALLASGRMTPTGGSVTRDPDEGDDVLRASTAVVDAPDISDPATGLRLDAVVQEELMFAELPSSSADVLDALDLFDARDFARSSIEHVPSILRLRVLAGLAARRPGIEAVVLTSPDRHGGDPFEWYPVAEELAERGLAVLVIAGAASVALLNAALADATTPDAAPLDTTLPDATPADAAPAEPEQPEAPRHVAPAPVAPEIEPLIIPNPSEEEQS